jgi:ppGpp synthetase/RelA/SpoT-type nucleotidyltranferase
MEPFAHLPPAGSPLYMAVHDPVLHQFISYLAEKKAEQESHPGLHVRIELSRAFMNRVRESFKQTILNGERHLHVISHVLGTRLLDGGYELHSNVFGVLPGGDKHPFLIRERITRETLFSHTDLDLGNQMLGKFRYRTHEEWTPLELSANFVEYIPLGKTTSGVNRITSRVKAEEELWNKVTDEMFGLDRIVERDKHLHKYSKYIKDIFGVKIVCDDEAACLRVHGLLADLKAGELEPAIAVVTVTEGPGPRAEAPFLEFVETKDYLTCDESQMKKTGWKALKSVVRWQSQILEIQVQPLANYYLELDHMSGPSHRSFKLQRDTLRSEIAASLPLYGFYRDLLRMLFLESSVSFDSLNASVVITD